VYGYLYISGSVPRQILKVENGALLQGDKQGLLRHFQYPGIDLTSSHVKASYMPLEQSSAFRKENRLTTYVSGRIQLIAKKETHAHTHPLEGEAVDPRDAVGPAKQLFRYSVLTRKMQIREHAAQNSWFACMPASILSHTWGCNIIRNRFDTGRRRYDMRKLAPISIRCHSRSTTKPHEGKGTSALR
jgi:hypothetical protein